VKRPTETGWLLIACALSLVGLTLMLWSLFDPRAPPVLIALTVGQGIGTLSFVIYLRVIVRDYRERRRRRLAAGGPTST
jgi:MFS family permease